jgi:tRNA (guanine37-N1)-methyltransferase
MKYSIITLFPEMIDHYCSMSIVGRARQNSLINIELVNPREFTTDNHRSVDDTPYGGGSGMVMLCDPIFKSFESIEKQPEYKLILTTPQGIPFNQDLAVELSTETRQLIIICGHYEGVDERIIEALKPLEVSAGDFVLTGGELAALCIIDATARLVKGVVGNEESVQEESFTDWLLEYPHYTRPAEYRGMKVPDILLSGHHKNINTWRRQQSIIRTYNKRPDLLEKANLTSADLIFLNEYKASLEKE